jgi:uncharacterized HAD superfamily protein
LSNNSNIQEEINKIFKIPQEINKEFEHKNNINIIKINNEKNKNKQSIKNINKQCSFASIQSSEVDKEIGTSSFLSESSEY